MSNAAQKSNDAFLTAAVEWIRLRLLTLASKHPRPEPLEAPRLGWLGRMIFGKTIMAPVAAPVRAPKDKEVADAYAAMMQAALADPAPAAIRLKECCGLSDFEFNMLLLCSAFELDTRVAGLCAQAHADPNKPYPTYALGLAVFPDPIWEALSPERPLRFWRLLEISQPAGSALTVSALRADERIVNALKGLDHLDERLSSLITPTAASQRPFALPPSHEILASTLAAGLSTGAIPSVIHLLGPDSAGKQAIAMEAARKLSHALFVLPAAMLPLSSAEVETLVRAWRRESLLLPVAIYVDARDAERDFPPVVQFLTRCNGLVFLDTRESWRNSPREALVLEVDRPTRAEQRSAWAEALRDEDLAGRLASQFQMSLPDIHRAAAMAGPQEMSSDEEIETRVWSACLQSSRPKLDLLAQRLDAKATWADLVLPEQEIASLREIGMQARRRSLVYDDWGFSTRMNRGLGLSALFCGESGTGKTMAAEVIANDLRLNLYRIDLSAVVSKYIGETEKNLRQVFDAAEDGGTILCFDEADSLFGKRTEVKDSHDRYANIEINYLLQRMEAYSGLAILTTNMKGSIDRAFLRRLRFIVQFPFPGAAERKRIWQRAFPADLPKEPLDYDFLARLDVAGGTVQNIALRAAFLAAAKRTPVSMELVLDAARAEFRKLERAVNEVDFRWRPDLKGAVA